MSSNLVVTGLHYGLTFLSVAALCLDSSIFDFIVSHKMFYTLPEQRILIDPTYSMLFFTSATLSLCLGLCSPMLPRTNSNSPFAPQESSSLSYWMSLTHGVTLLISILLSIFCSVFSLQTSMEVGVYAYDATPLQFQSASHWYFIRLRILFVVYACLGIFSASVLSLLYFGIRLKPRFFVQLPTKPAVF